MLSGVTDGALLGSEDLLVFHESPGDFGGASAVTAHTGLTVFGGSIMEDGSGDIVWTAM